MCRLLPRRERVECAERLDKGAGRRPKVASRVAQMPAECFAADPGASGNLVEGDLDFAGRHSPLDGVTVPIPLLSRPDSRLRRSAIVEHVFRTMQYEKRIE